MHQEEPGCGAVESGGPAATQGGNSGISSEYSLIQHLGPGTPAEEGGH